MDYWQVTRAMRYFPPETRVWTSVKFTKCLYAMTVQHSFQPDRRTGWTLAPVGDAQRLGSELGLKLVIIYLINWWNIVLIDHWVNNKTGQTKPHCVLLLVGCWVYLQNVDFHVEIKFIKNKLSFPFFFFFFFFFLCVKAVGFELLANVESVQQQKNGEPQAIEADPRWNRFLTTLKDKGFFQVFYFLW